VIDGTFAVSRARLPLRIRVVAGLLVVACLLGGVYMWLRDSALVAVQRVTVVGASGAEATKIRRALVTAAQNMTTLDVSMGALRTAVAPYPVVKDLQVSTQFPHGMRIRVIEQVPVAVVSVGGRMLAVAGDGTLLHDTAATRSLPEIPLKVPPGGSRLTGTALSAVAVLAAAPYELLPHVAEVTTAARHGLVAQLRNGPSIYFGNRTRLAAKWAAAAAVLVDSGSAGAVYIDVTDPGRPAAGVSGGSTSTTTPAGG
jgi:cell division protein FtsQ